MPAIVKMILFIAAGIGIVGLQILAAFSGRKLERRVAFRNHRRLLRNKIYNVPILTDREIEAERRRLRGVAA